MVTLQTCNSTLCTAMHWLVLTVSMHLTWPSTDLAPVAAKSAEHCVYIFIYKYFQCMFDV